MATEKEELDALIRAQVEEVLKGDKKDPVVTEPEPLKLNIAGQEHTFKTQKDLEDALNTTFATFRTQLEEAKKPKVEEKAGNYVTGKENTGPQFDQDEYVNLMHKDIIKAQNYALDAAFGIPNAVEAIKNSLNRASNLEQTVAVYQFRERHPEFQLTKENTDVVEGIRKELGQPFNAQGLEAAYGVAQARGLVASSQLLAYQKKLIADGVLPDPTKQDKTQENAGFSTGFVQKPQVGAPPPTVNRTGNSGVGTGGLDQLENLSTEQMEQVLRKAGLL